MDRFRTSFVTSFQGKEDRPITELLIIHDFELTPVEYLRVENFMNKFVDCPSTQDEFYIKDGFANVTAFKSLLVKSDLYNTAKPTLSWDPIQVETLADYVSFKASKRRHPDAIIPEYEWMMQFELPWLFTLGW